MRQDISKLPKREQKVIIAKDVLAQIKAGKYIPLNGYYINIQTSERDGQHGLSMNPELDMSLDAKKNFNKLKECEACAIGCTLLSITRYKNNQTFGDLQTFAQWDWDSSDNMNISPKQKSLLLSVFTPKEIYVIESLFEGPVYSSSQIRVRLANVSLSDTEFNKCSLFFDNIKDDTARLQAIMKHIIKNEGKISLTNLLKENKIL